MTVSVPVGCDEDPENVVDPDGALACPVISALHNPRSSCGLRVRNLTNQGAAGDDPTAIHGLGGTLGSDQR